MSNGKTRFVRLRKEWLEHRAEKRLEENEKQAKNTIMKAVRNTPLATDWETKKRKMLTLNGKGELLQNPVLPLTIREAMEFYGCSAQDKKIALFIRCSDELVIAEFGRRRHLGFYNREKRVFVEIGSNTDFENIHGTAILGESLVIENRRILNSTITSSIVTESTVVGCDIQGSDISNSTLTGCVFRAPMDMVGETWINGKHARRLKKE